MTAPLYRWAFCESSLHACIQRPIVACLNYNFSPNLDLEPLPENNMMNTKCLSSTDTSTFNTFTGAYLVQAMLLPSVGCGWHCLWLPGAHQCSSRRLAPGCSKAGAVSPAAAPQLDTPPPSCCPLHTVGKTSCFKCLKGHMQQIRWQKFWNNALV